MAPNFTHSIFDPFSYTRTQWIGDKVMLNYSLHISRTSWLHNFHETAAERLFKHVEYSDYSVVHIQRAVLTTDEIYSGQN